MSGPINQIIPGSEGADMNPSLSPTPQSSSSTSEENLPSAPGWPKTPQSGALRNRRSRVTPDQLVHLERLFSKNRTPTVAERKEISEQLGMQERQTQIWFQNRRAKQKTLDCKNTNLSPSPPSPTDPVRNPQFNNYLHEDDPVTIIPCIELIIGSWKRTANSSEANDLIAYVSYPKRHLFWYLRCSGQAFRIGIPFEDILRTHFTPMLEMPGTGCASIYLKNPPHFYMEQAAIGRPRWVVTMDWSEGLEASRTLRHDLIGPTIELARLLRNIRVSDSKAGPVPTQNLPRRAGWSTPDLAMWQNPNIQAWDLSHHLHPPVSPAPIEYPPPASYPSQLHTEWDHIPRSPTTNDTPSASPISLHGTGSVGSWSPIMREISTANTPPSPHMPVLTTLVGHTHSDYGFEDVNSELGLDSLITRTRDSEQINSVLSFWL